MTGHANSEILKVIGQLEATVDLETSPLEDILELGQLYIEPCHREDEAIKLFEAVLRRDPTNITAKFWLAYCCLHYLMDHTALRRAAILLESIIATNQYIGHAYMLLAEVLEEEGILSIGQKSQLLEASVRYEPEWVYNRQSLAWAYKQAGRLSEALEQLRRALANVKLPDPSWSITTHNFEESITGRIGYQVAEQLQSEILHLEKN